MFATAVSAVTTIIAIIISRRWLPTTAAADVFNDELDIVQNGCAQHETVLTRLQRKILPNVWAGGAAARSLNQTMGRRIYMLCGMPLEPEE